MSAGAVETTSPAERALPADVLPERHIEQACLGAALLNDDAARIVAAGIETLVFASPAHREIHAAICRLVARGEGVDALTVMAELDRCGGAGHIPGREYLQVLAETTPTATHVRDYIARVKEMTHERMVRERLDQAVMLAGGSLDGHARALLHGQLVELTTLLDGGGAGETVLPLHDGPGLAELQLEQPQALCEGLLYAGCSSDLVAEVKRGKTTLALAIARAVIDGEPWCGRATRKSGVLYLCEQSPHSFVPQVARADLLGAERFCTLFHRDVTTLSWPEIGECVRRQAAARHLDLIVVDNLSLWAGIEGDEENDAGVALATLRVIERLTGAGLAVLVLRHARKGGGSVNEAGRGSSALAGGFDVLIYMKGETHPRRRLLSVTGRVFPEEPPAWVIELTDDGRFRDLGSGAAVHRAEARRIVLDLLPTSASAALDEEEILDLCREHDIGKSSAQEILRALCDERDAARPCERAKGAGSASNRAYGYWRRDDAS